MKLFLLNLIIFVFGMGCALVRPYSPSPARTLKNDEITYFRSLVNVARDEQRASFEMTGYWCSQQPMLVIQGYLPPPTFRNLFSVMMTEDSMMIRNHTNQQYRLYLFDEDVQESYGSFLEIAGYAIYAQPPTPTYLQAGWREENSRSYMRLRRIPLLRRIRYHYEFEEDSLQETRIEFPRGVQADLYFHEHDKRREMPDVSRLFAVPGTVRVPVYEINEDNFEGFIQELGYTIDSAL